MTMLDVNYMLALAIVLSDETLTKTVRTLRVNGIRRLRGILAQYEDRGFQVNLLEAVWEHKIEFILCAGTKKVLDDILKPSTPGYNGGSFGARTPYHCEAEELMLWSLTSFRGPLIYEAFERFRELFVKYYPAYADKI